METSISKELKVGLFTVVGVIALLISILLLGGDRMVLQKNYQLKVKLNQVQGLGRGSVVSLRGVPVGNVRQLQFIPDTSDIEVTMDIDQDVQPRITVGSKASVKTQGALGDKYIYIEPGPTLGQPMNDGDYIEADRAGDLIDIITEKGAELAQIVEVIKEVRILVSNLNKDGRSAAFMENLVSGTNEFKMLMSEARKETLPQLSGVLRKINQGEGTLGALVNDPTLHTRLTQLFGGSPRNKFLTPLIRESIKESEKK